jgi:lipid II:glycine glycyltransferase (peptidoglycan interpeptide bridge formation enzyme)
MAIPVTLDCASNSFRVEWDRAPASPEWDDFLESSPDGHHEQTALWGQVRSQLGWQVERLLIREQGRIVAGAQVQLRRLGKLGRLAYVTYGPCIGHRNRVLDRTAIAELKRGMLGLKVCFLVVGLPYDAHRMKADFLAAGFQPKPRTLPPHFLQATAVVNLRQSTEQIMAAMRRSTRRNIRHALNKGLTLVEGGALDITPFYQLMCSLCQRRGITPNPARPDFFNELWHRFQPKGWIRLFFIKLGDELVSSALVFTFQDWFRVWKVGWSGSHANLKPNEGLWWQMIEWARRAGFKHFDFVEINPDRARAITSGSADAVAPEDVTSFKLGFGGEIKLLPGAYYYVFNPVLRTALRCGMARLLQSPLMHKLTWAAAK